MDCEPRYRNASVSALASGCWAVPRTSRCEDLVRDAFTHDFGDALDGRAGGVRLVMVGDSLINQFSDYWLQLVARENPALAGVSHEFMYLAAVPRSEGSLARALAHLCTPRASARQTVAILNLSLWYNEGRGECWRKNETKAVCRLSIKAIVERLMNYGDSAGDRNETSARITEDARRRIENRLRVRDYVLDVQRLAARLGGRAAAPLCPAGTSPPRAVLWMETTPRHFAPGTSGALGGSSLPCDGACEQPCTQEISEDDADNWRNPVANAFMHASGVPVLPVYAPLMAHGDWHGSDKDCLHWCPPSPVFTLMASAIFSAVAAVMAPSASAPLDSGPGSSRAG